MYRLSAMHWVRCWTFKEAALCWSIEKEHLSPFELEGVYFLRLEAGELASVDEEEDCQ